VVLKDLDWRIRTVRQTISAWLARDVGLKPDQLADQLASIVDQLNEPRLFLD
jgi:hypothetical protein